MNYDSLKKLLWPHFIVPLGAIVAVDYLDILTALIQIAAAFWLILQVLGCALGMWAGGMIRCTSGTHQAFWQSFFNYRLATLLPGLKVGSDLIGWLLTEVEVKTEVETKTEADHLADLIQEVSDQAKATQPLYDTECFECGRPICFADERCDACGKVGDK